MHVAGGWMRSGLGALSIGEIDDLHLAISTLRASWATNRESTLLYDEEFVRSFLSYPGDLPSMLPAVYCGDRLGGFVAGAQRKVLVQNNLLRLLLMTFLTVAADLKGNGLGVRVLVEAMKRAHAAGYDGAMYYSVIGNK